VRAMPMAASISSGPAADGGEIGIQIPKRIGSLHGNVFLTLPPSIFLRGI